LLAVDLRYIRTCRDHRGYRVSTDIRTLIESTGQMKFLQCRISDTAFSNGAGDVLLNVDQIVWIGKHPTDHAKTLVKLTNEVLLILAPFDDVAAELKGYVKLPGDRHD
jgi:hypothetical protein